jgi:hypothetical protein
MPLDRTALIAELLQPRPSGSPGQAIAAGMSGLGQALAIRKMLAKEDQKASALQGQQSEIVKALFGGTPGMIDESGAMGGAEPANGIGPTRAPVPGDPQRALQMALSNPEALASNPMLAQMLMQQLQPEETVNVPQGGALVRGGREIYRNPTDPKIPDILEKVKAAGFDPESPEGQAFAREMLLKPGVNIDMGEKFGPVPSGYKRVKGPGETGSKLVQEPGAPAEKIPAETRAKLGMLDASEKSLKEAQDLLFKDGGYRRGLLTAVYSPVRTGAAGQFYNAMRDALASRLRAESGGAITESEVADQLERYLPKPWDSKDEAQARFRRFNQFISSYRGAIGNEAATQPQQPGKAINFSDLPDG